MSYFDGYLEHHLQLEEGDHINISKQVDDIFSCIYLFTLFTYFRNSDEFSLVLFKELHTFKSSTT